MGGEMRQRNFLTVGLCLLTLALPFSHVENSHGTTAREDKDVIVARLLRHRLDQARELLSDSELTRVIEESAVSGDTYLNFIFSETHRRLPERWKRQSKAVAHAIVASANREKMDPLFVMAVIQQESRFKPHAHGGHGELGLMQIKPSTARWLMEKSGRLPRAGSPSDEELQEILRNPALNIRIGTAYLGHLREKFAGKGNLYTSAYNMGADGVRVQLRNGREPRIYSDKVLAHYLEFVAGLNPAQEPVREQRVASREHRPHSPPDLGLVADRSWAFARR